MKDPNRNALWSRVIAEELARHGISRVCITPGSRSTPLTVAFQRQSSFHIDSHLDERCSSFFTLGRARVIGIPTPLVCTSGTAPANFHPAVLEAHRSRVPMLLLTADRPPELHEGGANQTVSQDHLFGESVRWFKQLPEPGTSPRKLRSLRVTIGRAIQYATGTPAGPVHLNIPFSKPLEPVRVPGDVPDHRDEREPDGFEGTEGPYLSLIDSSPVVSDENREHLFQSLQNAQRPLVLAGPRPPRQPTLSDLTTFARNWKLPLLADPLSDLRFGPGAEESVCSGYETYLHPESPPEFLSPDLVLQVGLPLTGAKYLHDYLDRSGVERWVLDRAAEWKDPTFRSATLVRSDPETLLPWLSGQAPESRGDNWLRRWQTCESAYRDHLRDDRNHSDFLFEGHLMWDVIEALPEHGIVFAGNSLPIRDLDRYGLVRKKPLRVLGNRGASGIDGITSTALGAASATDRPLTVVLGDISFYHDMNGLLALERLNLEATIVVINNDGGGIFHMLPVEQYDPPFTPYIKTPHGLEFEHAARMYGCEYHRVTTSEEWHGVTDLFGTPGRYLIEVHTDGERSQRHREHLRSNFEPSLDSHSQ